LQLDAKRALKIKWSNKFVEVAEQIGRVKPLGATWEVAGGWSG